ncbi:hypothetical protein BDW02DRAFT_511823, partial [Decorospora gaudefroyi]
GTTIEILSLKMYVTKITIYLRYIKPYSTSLVVSTTKLRITKLTKTLLTS